MLASAAIPTLFRAVHIDDGAYWDGLFSQNPPLHDLLDAEPDEVWVVQVNPRERASEPTTLLDIADRRNELAGNLSLYQELGFIETIDRLLEDGLLTPSGKYKPVVVRIIELPRKSESRVWGPASKLNRDPAFLGELVAQGKAQADVFLAALAFERSWEARDADAIMRLFAEDAELVSADPFPRVDASHDPEHTRTFVTAHLCDSIRIDPVRKQIAEDRVTWSIRMRTNGAVIVGRAEAEIGSGGVSSLRLGPDALTDLLVVAVTPRRDPP